VAVVATEVAARVGRAVVLRHDGLVPAPSRTALSGLSESQWLDYDRLPVGELKPYVEFAPRANYRSATVNTNERGRRGRAVQNPKSSGRVRIVVLGGSAAFGSGASSDAATFPAQPEAALRARSQRDIEVVNAGAPAYVSGQELARLTFEVLDLEPNVVIVYNGFNDLNSPPLVRPSPRVSEQLFMARAHRAVQFAPPSAGVPNPARCPGERAEVLGASRGRRAGRRAAGGAGGGRRHPRDLPAEPRADGGTAAGARGPSGLRLSADAAGQASTHRGEGRGGRVHRTPASGYARRFVALLPRAVEAMRRVASARGVAFVDLSDVFGDAGGTIFFDTAHVTDRGNALVTDRLTPETEKLL
jgi:hypothetical protein